MFEKAGIEPATAEKPWTLAQLEDAAKKLTTDDCYGITMSLDAKDETCIYFFLPLIYFRTAAYWTKTEKQQKASLTVIQLRMYLTGSRTWQTMDMQCNTCREQL